MESRDGVEPLDGTEQLRAAMGQRPTLKPTRTGSNPPAPLDYFSSAQEKRLEDIDVRAVALLSAATLMASPDAHEEHVISLARRFEDYIRNG